MMEAFLAAATIGPPRAVTLRVMTWNVHSCEGRDGKVRPDRIAEVIARHRPDVVALQEVRVGRVAPATLDRPEAAGGPAAVPPPVGEPPLPPPAVVPPRRAGPGGAAVPFTDQPRAIAEAAGMYSVFYPLVRLTEQDYGIAVLSRHPVRIVRAANLPTLEGRPPLERRGALWVEVEVDGARVQLLNTHLGLNGRERAAQAEALAGPDWLGSPEFERPFIVCGDFNAGPGSSVYRLLSSGAVDAARGAPRRTWPSLFPVFRLDHILASPGARTSDAKVPADGRTRRASDHLPVVAEIVFEGR